MSGQQVFARDAASDARAFELQRTFRALLDCLARPGEVVFLESSERAAGDAKAAGAFPGTLMVADALLDAGTTFSVAEGPEGALDQLVARRTHARALPAERAAYALVTDAVRDEAATAYVESLSSGTLEEPHMGATCIIECSVLLGLDAQGGKVGSASHSHAKSCWELEGPGVDGAARIVVDRADVMRARESRGDEFPCGIDLVFVDGFGHMVAVPRSSACKEVESWDM